MILPSQKLIVVSFWDFLLTVGLTWNSHIDYICKNFARNIGVINRTKHFFPELVLLFLYNTLIGSYLNYGILAWGASSAANLNRLLLLQKRALRIINFKEFNAHTDPLFIQGKILKIYRIQLGSLMYQLTCNNLPSAIKSMFTLNSDVHSHFTRQASNFHIPYTHTSLDHKTITYEGPMLWNMFNKQLKASKTISNFKHVFKSVTLESYC